jgi:hypothetical protein
VTFKAQKNNPTMRSRDLNRFALFACVTSLMLAGCGGSQPPIGAPGEKPRTSAIATHADRGKSWMLPGAKSENLLYVSDDVGSEVYVLSYPAGGLVGVLTGFGSPFGECVDKAGHVWITNLSPPEIIEYAHGGTSPMATLSDADQPVGCAVDRKTGNLAVTNHYPGNIAVYDDARGTPTTYSDPDFADYTYCTYDDTGDLFVDDAEEGGIIAELPEGSGTLQTITLDEKLYPLSIQWDKMHLAIETQSTLDSDLHGTHGSISINRVQVSGSTGSVIGKTFLKAPGGRIDSGGTQFWISGNTIVGPDMFRYGKVGVFLWHYPRGGEPRKMLRQMWEDPWGVTVSHAQKQSR